MTLNINHFNPIGYSVQTQDGQTYKKSNIGKSAAIIGTAALDIFLSNSKYKNQFSLKNVLKNNLKINLPNKYEKPVEILGFVVDLGVAYGIGSWIDKQINKRRLAQLPQNITK